MIKKDGLCKILNLYILKMQKNSKRIVAKALHTTPSVSRYLPELLTDLWSLGCYPALMIDALSPLNLRGEDIRVLDLGCGKGAASIEIARTFGVRVTGIDTCEPFIAEAKQKAAIHGVEDLCRFEKEDIREYVKRPASFDVVLLASLGSILGNHKESIAKLRTLIRPLGYILLQSAFLRSEKKVPGIGYKSIKTRPQTLNSLLARGDTLVSEKIIELHQTRQTNRNYIRSMRRQAKLLIQRIPGLKNELNAYILDQIHECRIFESALNECMWLIQKKTS